MAQQNFTNIENLVEKRKEESLVSRPKEVEPMASKETKIGYQEVAEHEPEKEVFPFVKRRAESIKLPDDLKQAGLQTTETTQYPTYQDIRTPLSDEKVEAGLHAPITSSRRWLATLAEYILKMAHLQLKVVRGHVVRVLRK
jgi:hypothetical protein